MTPTARPTIVPTSLIAAALLLSVSGCGTSHDSSKSSVRVATDSAATSDGVLPPPPRGCVRKPTLTPEVAVVPLDSDPAIPIRVPFARAMAQAEHGQVWVVGYCAASRNERRRSH
jgi:hypothetical protein